MRLALLVGAVAVATAAAVIAVGRGAIDPKPLDPALVALEDLSWGERAGAQCVDYSGSVRAVVAGPFVQYETAAARAARLYAETTQIERELVAALRAIPGRPSGAAETLALWERRNSRDLEVAASLSRSFDRALLERELTAYEETASLLRARFRSLGSTGCVAYLDPATYED